MKKLVIIFALLLALPVVAQQPLSTEAATYRDLYIGTSDQLVQMNAARLKLDGELKAAREEIAKLKAELEEAKKAKK
jgi:hypothetical protein